MTVSKTKFSLLIRFDKYDFTNRIANPLIEFIKKGKFRYIDLSKTWIIENNILNEEKVEMYLTMSDQKSVIPSEWTNPKGFAKKIAY